MTNLMTRTKTVAVRRNRIVKSLNNTWQQPIPLCKNSSKTLHSTRTTQRKVSSNLLTVSRYRASLIRETWQGVTLKTTQITSIAGCLVTHFHTQIEVTITLGFTFQLRESRLGRLWPSQSEVWLVKANSTKWACALSSELHHTRSNGNAAWAISNGSMMRTSTFPSHLRTPLNNLERRTLPILHGLILTHSESP